MTEIITHDIAIVDGVVTVNNKIIEDLIVFEGINNVFNITTDTTDTDFWVSTIAADEDQIIQGNGDKAYNIPPHSSVRNVSEEYDAMYFRGQTQIAVYKNTPIDDDQETFDRAEPIGTAILVDGVKQGFAVDYRFLIDITQPNGVISDFIDFDDRVNGVIRFKHDLYNQGTIYAGKTVTLQIAQVTPFRTLYITNTDKSFVFPLRVLALPANIANLRIDEAMSEFVRIEYPLFMKFMEYYFDYVNQHTHSADILTNLSRYADLDETLDEFLTLYRHTFAADIPRATLADDKILLKNIRDFYLVKGNEQSYSFLLRILFGKESTMSNPKDRIFTTSDNEWNATNKLAVAQLDRLILNYSQTPISALAASTIFSVFLLDYMQHLDGTAIRGFDSGATANVIAVEFKQVSQSRIGLLSLERIVGEFIIGEKIIITGGLAAGIDDPNNPGTDLTTDDFDVYTVGQNAGYTIEQQGIDYTIESPVTFYTGGFDVGSRLAAVGAAGEVLALEVIKPGWEVIQDQVIGILSQTPTNNTLVTANPKAMVQHGGGWKNERSIASSGVLRLQDNYFWQQFSYVITSSVEFDKYVKHFKKLLHPSGSEMFGEFVFQPTAMPFPANSQSKLVIAEDQGQGSVFHQVVTTPLINVYHNDVLLLPTTDYLLVADVIELLPSLALKINDLITFEYTTAPTVTYSNTLELHPEAALADHFVNSSETILKTLNYGYTKFVANEQRVDSRGFLFEPAVTNLLANAGDLSQWNLVNLGQVIDNGVLIYDLFESVSVTGKISNADGIVSDQFSMTNASDYWVQIVYRMGSSEAAQFTLQANQVASINGFEIVVDPAGGMTTREYGIDSMAGWITELTTSIDLDGNYTTQFIVTPNASASTDYDLQISPSAEEPLLDILPLAAQVELINPSADHNKPSNLVITGSTKPIDDCTIPLPDALYDDGFTLLLEYDPTGRATEPKNVMFSYFEDASNFIEIYALATNAVMNVTIAGAPTLTVLADAAGLNTINAAFSKTEVVFSHNGAAIVTMAYGATLAPVEIRIGGVTDALSRNGFLKSFELLTRKLADSELTEIS